jgi:hypothetical protein
MNHEKKALIASIVLNAFCCTAIGFLAYQLNVAKKDITNAKGNIDNMKNDIQQTRTTMIDDNTLYSSILADQTKSIAGLKTDFNQMYCKIETCDKRLIQQNDLSSRLDLFDAIGLTKLTDASAFN